MTARSRGFSLVEVMVVAGIIALIAAIGIPNLLRARVESNQAAAKATLKAVSNALETFAVVNSSYPLQTTSLLGAAPPYLNKDYFTGTHEGYTYVATLAAYSYTVTASPVSASMGNTTYTITTGAVLSSSP